MPGWVSAFAVTGLFLGLLMMVLIIWAVAFPKRQSQLDPWINRVFFAAQAVLLPALLACLFMALQGVHK